MTNLSPLGRFPRNRVQEMYYISLRVTKMLLEKEKKVPYGEMRGIPVINGGGGGSGRFNWSLSVSTDGRRYCVRQAPATQRALYTHAYEATDRQTETEAWVEKAWRQTQTTSVTNEDLRQHKRRQYLSLCGTAAAAAAER